jgi:hypothetical protein
MPKKNSHPCPFLSVITPSVISSTTYRRPPKPIPHHIPTSLSPGSEKPPLGEVGRQTGDVSRLRAKVNPGPTLPVTVAGVFPECAGLERASATRRSLPPRTSTPSIQPGGFRVSHQCQFSVSIKPELFKPPAGRTTVVVCGGGGLSTTPEWSIPLSAKRLGPQPRCYTDLLRPGQVGVLVKGARQERRMRDICVQGPGTGARIAVRPKRGFLQPGVQAGSSMRMLVVSMLLAVGVLAGKRSLVSSGSGRIAPAKCG